ncbi:hypothetical protein [Paenibacillus pasadenensis]|uniref:hypothetical protein n=1 Tax=Paenibacillus pasadenensis TaxID=217090 RepID=UPI000C7C7F60|nr:hypothetical protein [Paenibacillus pasadenensis]
MIRVKQPSSGSGQRVKLQARIPLTTRYRLTKVAETINQTGTQTISDLIAKTYEETFGRQEPLA